MEVYTSEGFHEGQNIHVCFILSYVLIKMTWHGTKTLLPTQKTVLPLD